jgi:hypothetical protein
MMPYPPVVDAATTVDKNDLTKRDKGGYEKGLWFPKTPFGLFCGAEAGDILISQLSEI